MKEPKRMGRPLNGERKSELLHFRCQPDLYEMVRAAAEAEDRSITNMIERIIRQHFRSAIAQQPAPRGMTDDTVEAFKKTFERTYPAIPASQQPRIYNEC